METIPLELHEPLATHIGGLGFHVLSCPDSDIDYPPETPERSPPNHYETYVAAGILKKAWVEKHTKQIPVRLGPLPPTQPLRLTLGFVLRRGSS
jgi:hypothetical protein